MKNVAIFLTFFIILVPIVDAVPLVEIFVDENTPSNQNIPQVIASSVENGDLELLVWYLDPNSSLHITAATERAEDLNAQNGDLFIQGIYWNNSNENLPNDIDGLDIELNVKRGNDSGIILEAKTTLENELDQTVVLQWLLLKRSVSISEHPIGPSESNVVSYHAWDSNINRTKGAENQWTHQIEPNTLESWNIGNEELIAIVSLISLESKEIQGSGSSEIILYQSQESDNNHATSFLLIFSGIIGSILVIQSERKRQKNMPLIRPLIIKKNNDIDYDYFIEITTRQALVKEITIDGNGYWKCSSNEIPKEISPRTSKKIKIRQISKEGKNEPCTIRLEVDGYERWVLDIVFPET
tara:strand:+ start:2757 stop:3821 length:1065 start_codon:yes stop_codon:yes gene_type:complete